MDESPPTLDRVAHRQDEIVDVLAKTDEELSTLDIAVSKINNQITTITDSLRRIETELCPPNEGNVLTKLALATRQIEYIEKKHSNDLRTLDRTIEVLDKQIATLSNNIDQLNKEIETIGQSIIQDKAASASNALSIWQKTFRGILVSLLVTSLAGATAFIVRSLTSDKAVMIEQFDRINKRIDAIDKDISK